MSIRFPAAARRLAFPVALLVSLPAFAHPAVGIVVAPNGDVFYSDLAQVWRVTRAGVREVVVREVHAHELWIDAAGAVSGEDVRWLGGDRYRHRVWKRTPDGRVSDVVPWTEGFFREYPSHWVRCTPARVCSVFTRDRNGRVHDIVRQGRVNNPINWIVTAPSGEVYVIDGPELRRVDRQGKIETLARLNSRALLGVSLDAAGNVYVSAHFERVVYRVSPKGEVSVAARSPAPWMPSGMAVSPRGEMWVLEWNGPEARIRRAR